MCSHSAWVPYFKQSSRTTNITSLTCNIPIEKRKIFFCIGSAPFTLTFVFYCFCYKLITKVMLPTSLNYIKWPISGSPAFPVTSIKLKYLCSAHRKLPDKAHLQITAGRKKLTQCRTRTLTPSLLVKET